MARFLSCAFASLGLLLAGCSDELFGLAQGESCSRSVQCGPGLACVMGVCDPDPTGLGGMVPGGTGGGGGTVSDGGGTPPPPSDAGDPPPPPPPPPDGG